MEKERKNPGGRDLVCTKNYCNDLNNKNLDQHGDLEEKTSGCLEAVETWKAHLSSLMSSVAKHFHDIFDF